MAEVDSDEDLTKDLQPLAYHVSNRKGVFREAIKALKGKRLEAMIPPMLKSWDRSRLECACVEILEELDDDTLLAILDGRVGSAGVTAVEQTPARPVKPKKLKKPKVAKEEIVVSEEPKKKKKKKILEEENLKDAKLAKLKKKKKLAKAKAKIKKKKKDIPQAVPEDTPVVAPHKSLMELLELEYRAKAIKALLRSQGQSVPDIPINIDDDEMVNELSETTSIQNKSSLMNGNVTATKSNLKSDQKNTFKQPMDETNSSTVKTIENKLKRKKEITITEQLIKHKPKQATPEPKNQVLDLIDEALNASFNEETDSKTVLADSVKPVPVIVNACTRLDVDENELRSKLVQKIQKQKKKRRNKPKQLKEPEEEEDILDLHPQELGLSDEEGVTNNISSSSPDSSESEEVKESENDSGLQTDVQCSQIGNVISKFKIMDEVKEEELIYDDDVLEDDDDEDCNEQEKQVLPISNAREDGNSLQSNQIRVAQNNDSKDMESSQALVSESNSGSLDKAHDNNPISKIGVEKLRDRVFETATDNVGFSIKRKIAFRIDPGRIGALEEKGAEEAKKAEERKREEEEQLKKDQNFVVDIEEGEIDSNEDDSTQPEPNVSRTPSPRTEKDRKHSSESENSDDSENSSTQYGRRRKRRREKYSRDFGAYSPKRISENAPNTGEEPKRTSSPVEYINQFSDMEPISDDSNQSIPKKLPVSGCERNEAQTSTPENLTHNEGTQESSAVEKLEANEQVTNETDDDECENADLDNPKPITWYERWAQSHGMQKVVKTNKIHKKVRSKLKKLSDKKKPIEIPKDEPSIEAEPIIGSIEEYEKLFGKKVISNKNLDVRATVMPDLNPTNTENIDDDDEDDLWGDIIGGS